MKISVVMSAFNEAEHLAETIDSVLAQTVGDFELIVVDDGSTDATPEILRRYASADPRVRVLTQANAGLTRALMAGCAAARAPLIARQDAGDLSDPRRLEVQRAMFDASPEVVFVSCATQFVGPELEPLWIARPSGAALAPARILDDVTFSDGPTSHPSTMFRRDAYERAGGYRAAFYYGQDFDLWYRLAELGLFQTTNDVLYTARVTPESISGAARRQQQRLAMLSRAACEARRQGRSDDSFLRIAAEVRPVRRKSRRNRASGLYFIGEALRRNGDRRARSYLQRSIIAWPFSVRAWIRCLQSLVLSAWR